MKISNICDINKSSLSKRDLVDDIIYLDTSNLTSNRIDCLQKFARSNSPSRAQRKVQHNTILYSMVRPNQLHYGILKNPETNLIVSTGFVTIDIKHEYCENIDADYLYYILTQSWVTNHLQTIAENSVSSYPSISPNDLADLEFNFPDIKIQRQIAAVLNNICSKIELNRSLNHNLEAMAKQLYDYWFVQFDFPDENGRPYKSSGGKMVWNDELKRNIPSEWNICSLGNYISENNTGDWGYDEPAEKRQTKVGCIRGADIIKLNNLPIRYIKDSNTNKLLSPWDIVIEVSGGSPTQATGRSAYITPGVLERNGGKLTCSNFCHSFSMGNNIYSAFFYYTWRLLYDNDNMFNYEGKTSGIKNFMTETFLANKWVEVPHNIAAKFFAQVKTIYEQKDLNEREILLLTKQRDELLPLLMNGQVSVNYDLAESLWDERTFVRIRLLPFNDPLCEGEFYTVAICKQCCI